MRRHAQKSIFFFFFFFFFFFCFMLLPSSQLSSAKKVIEPCSTGNSCPALLAYRLPWASKLSDVASRFQLNLSSLLASNNFNPTNLPLRNYQIIPAKTLIKVPISCPCVDGIHRSVSIVYDVHTADTLDLISEGFGRLVSVDQIRSANGIDEEKQLASGQRLVIRLPCVCFNNSDGVAAAVYMSYAVAKRETLSSIVAQYKTTVADLKDVNGLGLGMYLPFHYPADKVIIINAACSSANLNWQQESLTVPNGSYALTANDCIICRCAPLDLSVGLLASSCLAPIYSAKAPTFSMAREEVCTEFGCNVSACVYQGHSGSQIFSSLVNYSHIQCSGNNSQATTPAFSRFPVYAGPPSSPPSLSSSSASNQPTIISPVHPTTRHSTSCTRSMRSFSRASCFCLFLLELAHSFLNL